MDANANANPNANVGGSTTALCELCSSELKTVCLLYPYLPTFNPPHYPKLFLALLDNNFFFFFWALFSSENHDFPITQQCKKKKTYANKIFFIPTYPTKKYRVGVWQTNSFLGMASNGHYGKCLGWTRQTFKNEECHATLYMYVYYPTCYIQSNKKV